ncbi:hypothetical protein [Puia dinghuensis]|uniref:LysM domain-containing protein n=1 Tax=Puia dinghuensis TaxID=1792502 RepID=A0A8J2XRE5_9BACT|nr:hypothetical protein [Puia dinghuensis]GGA88673.1 hypothetical protein GCM10011511_09870 [Puia dinghuensis]
MASLPTNPLQIILQQTGQVTSYFAPSSRYYPIAVTSLTSADGAVINYVRRRFVPRAGQYQLLQLHTVTEGQRLDNITNQYIGDPTMFWQLCDANNVLDPAELTVTIGRQIRITLPQGIKTSSNGNNNNNGQ